jgi:hypothetical protein
MSSDPAIASRALAVGDRPDSRMESRGARHEGIFYEIVSLPERRSALGEQAAISNDNANT